MNRGSFLRGLAVFPAALIRQPDDGYEPVGLMDSGTPGFLMVERVLLDGVQVDHVFETNDVEGWLRRFDSARGWRPQYLTGEVRLIWKTPCER